jgi:small conductance mechanosensitive channel
MEFDLNSWWPVAVKTGRILLVLVMAWVAGAATKRLIRRIKLLLMARTPSPDEARRIDTIGRVIRYFSGVIITALAALVVLSELGVSIAPILGAAGVVGIAVGFGAQSIVKDYFTGFVLLLENQIRQGDVVRVGGKAGLVEDLTLRYVQLRDYDGYVHYVPTGMIDTVTNMGREYAKAVVDVGVAYGEDMEECLRVMRDVGSELRADPAFAERITEELEMVGVERWDDSAVILRCRFTVRPLEQWNVRREYLKRLKRAFDREGIEIPFPHMTLYAGRAKRGETPPLPIEERGAV